MVLESVVKSNLKNNFIQNLIIAILNLVNFIWNHFQDWIITILKIGGTYEKCENR